MATVCTTERLSAALQLHESPPRVTADYAPGDSALPGFGHTSRRLELDLAAP